MDYVVLVVIMFVGFFCAMLGNLATKGKGLIVNLVAYGFIFLLVRIVMDFVMPDFSAVVHQELGFLSGLVAIGIGIFIAQEIYPN